MVLRGRFPAAIQGNFILNGIARTIKVSIYVGICGARVPDISRYLYRALSLIRLNIGHKAQDSGNLFESLEAENKAH
eukprot:3697154-Ditylum_brightwellii.AAC.1